MKEYTIKYVERDNIRGYVFETTVTANNIEEAILFASEDLDVSYEIVSVEIN